MTTRRVELVPAAEVAAARVVPWFAAAWSDMYGPQPPASTPAADAWLRGAEDEERLIALVDDQPQAFVAAHTARGALEMLALAVAAAARNEGVGAEIVYLLEQRASVPRARAYFPLANGYAFYFWLRSGYRPIFASAHRHAGLNAVERDLR